MIVICSGNNINMQKGSSIYIYVYICILLSMMGSSKKGMKEF